MQSLDQLAVDQGYAFAVGSRCGPGFGDAPRPGNLVRQRAEDIVRHRDGDGGAFNLRPRMVRFAQCSPKPYTS